MRKLGIFIAGVFSSAVGAASFAADFDPIPAAWNIRIDAPGTLRVGAPYCTESGECRWVGENVPQAVTKSGPHVPFIQACRTQPEQQECVAAAVPVQVLARSRAGAVIVRFENKNYATTVNDVYLELNGKRVLLTNMTPQTTQRLSAKWAGE